MRYFNTDAKCDFLIAYYRLGEVSEGRGKWITGSEAVLLDAAMQVASVSEHGFRMPYGDRSVPSLDRQYQNLMAAALAIAATARGEK